MLSRSGFVFILLSAIFASQLAAGEPAYAPEADLEKLIQQTASRDKSVVQKAIEQLAATGDRGTRALNWHLFQETTAAGAVRWAELLARCGRGRTGYRVLLELQPEGAGTLTLSSDRALLADCGKRYARINRQPEPNFSDEDLKHNPYSKAELLKHLNDSVKFLEARVEPRGQAIDAIGILSFKNFDAFTAFADSFDADAYNMLAGTTLTDSGGLRTLSYRALAEEDRKQYERNLLLFHNIVWEYVLDLKTKVVRSNAHRTEGTRLIWSFNCYQMLTGQAQVSVSFDNTGLSPRAATRDTALPLPSVANGNQPTAVVTHPVIRAKVCKTAPQGPRKKEILREQNQLVELDGSGSLPPGNLQYQWTQTAGPDLNLSPQQMARPDVSLIIKEAGEYRFELIVSLNGVHSRPAEVKVYIEDDTPAAPVSVAEKQPETPRPVAPAPITPAPEAPKVEPVKVAVAPQPAAAPAAPPQNPETPKPAGPVDAGKAKELHAQGEALLKQFKFAEAKAKLTEALALNPEDRQCAFDLGLALMECGEYQAAISKFEDSANAKNAKAIMNIGHCFARLKNLQEAARWYKRGAQIGKGAVEWEARWQMGHASLKDKDYKDALMLLTEAERSATQANVKDPRLLYDLAQAYQGSGKTEEARTALASLRALGYTPEPAVAEAIEKGGAALVASPEPETKVAAVPPPEAKKPQPAPEPVRPQPVKPIDKNAPAAVVDLNALPPPPVNPEPKVEPKAPEPKPETKAPEPKVAEVKKPEPPKADPPPAKVEPAIPKQPETPPAVAAPKKTESKPAKKEPKVVIPRKPMPPIPADYDQAFAAGKRAHQEGQNLLALNTDESRQLASHSFDEAEAMYRGALKARPNDEAVLAAFKELSKHVGAIAVVRSTHVKAKVRGLVVLDAELSIVAPGRPLYCVWEQVEGEDLGLRPENMAQKKVGIRIPQPGIYAFEVAVSDGSRGGTPVRVTVEVVE